MIIKYECLDCLYCLSYDMGWRIACSCPLLESNAIYQFLPLGEKDAEECEGFVHGEPTRLTGLDLDEATKDLDNTSYTDLLVEYVARKNILPWLKRNE